VPAGAPLAADTSAEAERRQIEIWRSLSTIQIAELIAGASEAARQLALAGLRARYPNASPRELVMRLCRLTVGSELATKAYPELEHLDP
jgi:hypothetical protein